MTEVASSLSPPAASNASTPPAPALASQRVPDSPSADRTRGHSPSMDHRAKSAAEGTDEPQVEVGGNKYSEKQVIDAIAERAQREILDRARPQRPEDYAAKLPESFNPGVGANFELDAADPLYAAARQLAHSKGWSQADFTDLLGVYAAHKVGEAQRTEATRQANLKQLGSAAPARLDAAETFLKAHAGEDGKAFAAFLKAYPSATFLRAIEKLHHAISNQGAASFDQRGRSEPEPQTSIPKFDGGNFSQVRAAQDHAAQVAHILKSFAR